MKVTNAPSIISSPWAKLTTFITPKMSVMPVASSM